MQKIFVLWDRKEGEKYTVTSEKKKSGEWVAICPKHDDHNPSLRINEEKRVYICDVCKWGGALYNPDHYRKKKIVSSYDYKDEKGNLLFQVIRYSPKTFRQRQPDGKGGWIWNLKGVRRVLYRLPELLNAPDPVFIVEGEKDADNLWELRLTATTCPMGAKKWEPEYDKYLTNRSIILLPDNDTEGLQHMEQVGKSLSRRAKQIKWLELLGLEEKEDVSDWIAGGGTRDKLLEMAKRAPDFKPATKCKSSDKPKEITKTLIPGLIHLVKEDGEVKYLLKDREKLRIQESFVFDGTICKPKQDLPIKIPHSEIINESMDIDCKELLNDVTSFIKSYLELPDESGYLILALWVFHTYLIEKFNTTPILYFYGVKETGKTRAGEVLAQLAFRCERLTSLTEATLFRSADYFKNSLVIDEIKLWGPEGNQEVARLIKSRYKGGLKVPRVNLNKKGEDQIEYFDVFGPLVICTTESIPDIIESRCITFLMQKNANSEVESLIDEEWASKLRSKLTIFRANRLDKDLAETQQIARRRLNEIMMPLYQTLILIDPERKEEFKMIVEEMEKAREEEEGLSLEAEIVEGIINHQKENQEERFLTTEITERLNRDRTDKEKLSNRLVSMRIKRLGFEKTRLENGKRGFKIKPELLERLALHFGINA